MSNDDPTPAVPDDPSAPGGAADGAAPAGLDLSAMLEQAMAMKEQIDAAQQEAAAQVVVGRAGGGVVTVEVTGGMEFRSVTIAPEVVDPEDVEMLQDLVLAALRDAADRAAQLGQQAMGQAGIDLDAFGLGGT